MLLTDHPDCRCAASAAQLSNLAHPRACQGGRQRAVIVAEGTREFLIRRLIPISGAGRVDARLFTCKTATGRRSALSSASKCLNSRDRRRFFLAIVIDWLTRG